MLQRIIDADRLQAQHRHAHAQNLARTHVAVGLGGQSEILFQRLHGQPNSGEDLPACSSSQYTICPATYVGVLSGRMGGPRKLLKHDGPDNQENCLAESVLTILSSPWWEKVSAG